jgi:hypothetical protein
VTWTGDPARLFLCMDHLADVERWLATISAAKRREFYHPATVRRHFERATKVPQACAPNRTSQREIIAKLEDEISAMSTAGGASMPAPVISSA